MMFFLDDFCWKKILKVFLKQISGRNAAGAHGEKSCLLHKTL